MPLNFLKQLSNTKPFIIYMSIFYEIIFIKIFVRSIKQDPEITIKLCYEKWKLTFMSSRHIIFIEHHSHFSYIILMHLINTFLLCNIIHFSFYIRILCLWIQICKTWKFEHIVNPCRGILLTFPFKHDRITFNWGIFFY